MVLVTGREMTTHQQRKNERMEHEVVESDWTKFEETASPSLEKRREGNVQEVAC